MINKNENYCMYLRKSRADQDAERHGKGETLARHQDMLNALANQLGIKVSAVFKEIVSGETISARPEMIKLLNQVEQGLWNGVLVVEVERLARGNTIDQGIVAQAFQLSGTKIITPTKTYDPNNEFDEEYFEFGLFMSRREYKTITRRIQRGRVAAVKEGKYIASTAPYGYERYKLPDDKGYSLRIIPEQADVVKMIFDYYINGIPSEDGTRTSAASFVLCRHLDSLGIKTISGAPWSPSSIRDILKNPVYTGKLQWGKEKDIKVIENGNVTIKRVRDKDCLVVDGIHEPIIDEDTFNKAAAKLVKNRKSSVPSSLQLRNPLSGIVYCEKCGNLMTRLGANSRNKYDTLKCPNRYCDNVSAPIYLIEKRLLDSLETWLNEYKLSLNQESLGIPSISHIQSSMDAKVVELKQIEQQIEKTYDLLERGIYDDETFLSRNNSLKGKRSETLATIDKFKKLREEEEKILQLQNEFIPNVEKIVSGYYEVETAEQKNILLKNVLQKVTYLKTERNTRGKLNNDNFTLTLYPLIPQN